LVELTHNCVRAVRELQIGWSKTSAAP
jgi:hypothetical protein